METLLLNEIKFPVINVIITSGLFMQYSFRHLPWCHLLCIYFSFLISSLAFVLRRITTLNKERTICLHLLLAFALPDCFGASRPVPMFKASGLDDI